MTVDPRQAAIDAERERRAEAFFEGLQQRFPQFVDDRTRIEVRSSWSKWAWLFLERVEQLDFDHHLLRLHHVYEERGKLVIDYDSGSTSPASIPPRIALRIRHIAEEIQLEARLQEQEQAR